MKTQNFTQGPWEANIELDSPLIHSPAHNIAYVVWGTHTTKQECNANAALIAAAPEMFEALQNALNVLAGIATGDLKTITADSNAIKLARAALQKVKGQ